MKTHLTILLLLLLVFVGIFDGVAQTETLKTGLMDEEVIRLRNELVVALQNDSTNKAKQIVVLLWKAQTKEGDYINSGEYCSVLFLSNDFDKLLAISKEMQQQLNLQPEFIDDTIKQKLIDSEQDILIVINKHPNVLDRIRLREILFHLTANRNSNDFTGKPSSTFSSQDNSSVSQRIYRLNNYNYRTNYYGSTSSSRKKRPTNWGFGIPLLYQIAYYTGTISNHVSSHRMACFPILTCDLWFWRFFFQYNLGPGKGRSNTLIINDEVFHGPFYSQGDIIHHISLGFEAFNNKFISIVPNFGISGGLFYLYPEAVEKHNYIGNMLKYYITDYYTAGLIIDYKVLDLDTWHDSYLGLRLEYEYGFSIEYNAEKIEGAVHQITFGVVLVFRDNRNR